MEDTVAYIFGYGSLLHPEDWVMGESSGEVFYGHLENHWRSFEVGIDNMNSQYDQKHYLERGRRANCIIGTLGIWPEEGSFVNGAAIPVGYELLQRIDQRERSYIRSGDLREFFSMDLPRPLLTYYPKEENYQLYLRGREEGRIFLPRRYWDYCAEAFRFYGGEEDFYRLTEEADYPTKNLEFYRARGAL